MSYSSLEQCLIDLEKNGMLIRIKEEIDPELEMAAVHMRVQKAGGPALLFENIKGTKFRAASNIFGTEDRVRFIFRDGIEKVKRMVQVKSDPAAILRKPFSNLDVPFTAFKALPKRISSAPVLRNETTISKLPLIKHWPMDGGAFVTLPIVYTEDQLHPGVMNSNIGMYRIQLNGNDYITDKEIGLHYQLHRGIGVHQSIANNNGQPLRVTIAVGGPPSLTFGAVMPLPEGLSELTFSGVLGNRRIRYAHRDNYSLLADADFIISGEVFPHEVKPEGPFGDHLGYYSLRHDFPLMHVHKVWHRDNAIWPFTVVGRPPQEDSMFGWLVHELTGDAMKDEIPGVKAVHAVDGSGVHPLLLAIGSERYTPYSKDRKPAEILTIANRILGTGQLSLAKFLFICAQEDQPSLNIYNLREYFTHILERIDFTRDLHFHTRTTIDTLDYSGSALNEGSKLVLAAAGEKKRELDSQVPNLNLPDGFSDARIVLPGVLAIQAAPYKSPEQTQEEMKRLSAALANTLNGIAMITVCDNSEFTAANIDNWVWVTFTRNNPAHDVYGVNEFTENKHWGCRGPLLLDSRIKPHHAPALELNAEVENRIERFFVKSASLHGIS
ncbi:MAG: UbiD family decarboxylase [Bacteroidia bacterium]|nr:UbiD family decarboxylase [Bacteroidia bacterium]